MVSRSDSDGTGKYRRSTPARRGSPRAAEFDHLRQSVGGGGRGRWRRDERFEELTPAGAGRSAHDEVLVAVDPLEGGQRALRRRRPHAEAGTLEVDRGDGLRRFGDRAPLAHRGFTLSVAKEAARRETRWRSILSRVFSRRSRTRSAFPLSSVSGPAGGPHRRRLVKSSSAGTIR